jgi:hypothetical protein
MTTDTDNTESAAAPPPVLFGFFSLESYEHGCGSSFYLREDGTEAEVTAVYPTETAEGYQWKDKRCLGRVTRWVRIGQRSKHFDYHAPDFRRSRRYFFFDV